MEMDLSGSGGDFHFNIFAWEQVLKLAQMYGWEPAGTEAPQRIEDEDAVDREENAWEGGYWTNDGQRVSAEDAQNLAEALKKALPDIPDHDALENKSKEIMTQDGPIRVIPINADVNPLESFSGRKGKRYLRKFITFCRAGGFVIW
jgi:hypothetical protein